MNNLAFSAVLFFFYLSRGICLPVLFENTAADIRYFDGIIFFMIYST